MVIDQVMSSRMIDRYYINSYGCIDLHTCTEMLSNCDEMVLLCSNPDLSPLARLVIGVHGEDLCAGIY